MAKFLVTQTYTTSVACVVDARTEKDAKLRAETRICEILQQDPHDHLILVNTVIDVAYDNYVAGDNEYTC